MSLVRSRKVIEFFEKRESPKYVLSCDPCKEDTSDCAVIITVVQKDGEIFFKNADKIVTVERNGHNKEQ